MEEKKSKLPIIILILIIAAGALFFLWNNYFGKNVVSGQYTESNLSIHLKEDYTFTFYNGVSNSSSSGTYSFSLSEDEKYAHVTLNVTSGSCSYDGALVYSAGNNTYLIPKIGSREISARRMVKIG